MEGTIETQLTKLLGPDVVEVTDRDHLLAKLKSGKTLRVKFGIDPTSSHIHLGRAITLRKLRDFQKLGHTIVLIIGDFTAQIGDASDKSGKRPMLSPETIKANLKTYRAQIGKILDLKKVEFRPNSKWLAKLTLREIMELAEIFSVQQMLARRNFSERHERGDEISLREFMYPLLQGYDSVAVKADVEVGGTDQLFNLKAGRVVQSYYGQEPQDIVMTEMLEGTDGRKMSSSWGNVINIDDTPRDMFAKVMAVDDSLMFKYFRLCTDLPEPEIKRLEERLKTGENPKFIKMILASEITALYHGAKKANKAREEFDTQFTKKAMPKNISEASIELGEYLPDELLVTLGLVTSKSEARRLIEQRGVRIGDNILDSTKTPITITPGLIIRVGKLKFVKIV